MAEHESGSHDELLEEVAHARLCAEHDFKSSRFAATMSGALGVVSCLEGGIWIVNGAISISAAVVLGRAAKSELEDATNHMDSAQFYENLAAEIGPEQ